MRCARYLKFCALYQEFSASLAGNPHTRAEIEISYDVSGLAPETFEQLEER